MQRGLLGGFFVGGGGGHLPLFMQLCSVPVLAHKVYPGVEALTVKHAEGLLTCL